MCFSRHTTTSASTYYRDVIMFACGGSALLGALAVMSLINKIRGRGRYVISI